MNRRGFIGSIVALFGLAVAPVEANADKAVLEGDSSIDMKFHEFVCPKLVGWRGYWYRNVDVQWTDHAGRTCVSTRHEILAFEDLNGIVSYSPWAKDVKRPHRALPRATARARSLAEVYFNPSTQRWEAK